MLVSEPAGLCGIPKERKQALDTSQQRHVLLEGGDGRSNSRRTAMPGQSRWNIVFQPRENLLPRGGPLRRQPGNRVVDTCPIEKRVGVLTPTGHHAGLGYVQEVRPGGPFKKNDAQRLAARGSRRPRANNWGYSFKQFDVGVDERLKIVVADNKPEVDVRPSIGGPFPEAAAEPRAKDASIGLEDPGRALDQGRLRQFGWIRHWNGLCTRNMRHCTISPYWGGGCGWF